MLYNTTNPAPQNWKISIFLKHNAKLIAELIIRSISQTFEFAYIVSTFSFGKAN